VAKSGSPTKNSQGEKIVKSGGGQEMAVMVDLWQRICLTTILLSKFCADY